MDWREHFRNTCERHRWMVAELCRRSGIKRDTFQNWLRDEADKGEIAITDAIKISEITDLTLDELFRGKIPDPRVQAILHDAVAQLQAARQDDLSATVSGTG